MSTNRQLSMLMLLQARGHVTAQALAAEFGISMRTVYRDVAQLGSAGIPICAERGPGGGFHLLGGYQTRLTGLTSAEAEALFLIGLPEAAAALGIGPASVAAARKMLAALPLPRRAEADRLLQCLHVDAVDWYRAAPAPDCLPILTRAVVERHGISMTYASWTGTRSWRVDPLGLVTKAGAWYLVARTQAKISTFKVANLSKLNVEPRTFERPEQFDLPGFWRTSVARFEAELRQDSATLLATAEGCRRLRELGAYAEAAVAAAKQSRRHGWVRLQLPVEGEEQAVLTLLGIGAEIEVLSPAALRARLRGLAREVAGRNR